MMTFKHATAITTSDTNAVKYRAIYVGGTGDLAVQTLIDSANVVFKAVPVGTTIWIEAGLVLTTGTTATNLVGLN